MRGLILSWIAACCLFLACCGSASAQGVPPDKADAAKKEEPKRVEREGSSAVSYTLAAIGTIIVMVLVCMPARRE